MAAAQPAKDFDFAELYAAVVRHALLVSPNATDIRIVVETPSGDTVIQVPMALNHEDLGSRVLAALATLPAGERMAGRVLAEMVDCDPKAGNFQKAVARLKEAEKIDVHKLYGYKLA